MRKMIIQFQADFLMADHDPQSSFISSCCWSWIIWTLSFSIETIELNGRQFGVKYCNFWQHQVQTTWLRWSIDRQLIERKSWVKFLFCMILDYFFVLPHVTCVLLLFCGHDLALIKWRKVALCAFWRPLDWQLARSASKRPLIAQNTNNSIDTHLQW